MILQRALAGDSDAHSGMIEVISLASQSAAEMVGFIDVWVI